ncbi:MAG: hypothetical protein U1F98_00620 [Verrucomicrobiota bacterium]
MKGQRALTLVELLLTVSTVLLLATLAMSGAGRVRDKARAVPCLSNLRQWGAATMVYAGDHQGWLPKDGAPNGTSVDEGWYNDLPAAIGLPPYHRMPWRKDPKIDPGRSLWICPSNPRRSNGTNLFHYCLNEHVNGTGNYNRPVPLSSLPRPVLTVWLFDNGKLAAVAQQNNVHNNLHNHGAQLLFLDGHARRFDRWEIWDSKHQCGRTNNPEIVWIP